MLFKYRAVSKEGSETTGVIDAFNKDVAISSLQSRGLVIVTISESSSGPAWKKWLGGFYGKVPMRDLVILSRQLSTLFEAKVSVMDTFRLLSQETENQMLREKLVEVTDDIQSGVPISAAISKHPSVFSPFYVNMVKSGEESGKLPEAFTYLADYLDRSYDLVSKAKNALIYPAFVIVAFFLVMILMLVFVIPRLTDILTETGQAIPLYTRIVMGVSSFLINYGLFLVALIIVGLFFLWRYAHSESGGEFVDKAKLQIPYIGSLYRRFYLSRIADNMNTLVSSGVSMIRSVEITAEVVGSKIYQKILLNSVDAIKSGNSLSESLGRYDDVPPIMTQMIRIGEETGNLGFVLGTLAKFYRREVDNAVDTIVSLIEPAMIIMLGLAVAVLLVSVLGPIYNITASI
ncbi:MAG: type II secretion system F family protein [Candidatus Paceibacterota bacterium]|jgi:type IV pilus assembly protein PilC